MQPICKIVQNPIGLEEIISQLADGRHGAQNIFIGNVRNHNFGKEVISVSYDAFQELAENIFLEICVEAEKQWGSDLRFVVVHRVGSLKVGESSIVVAVGSPHRDESYQASRYIIEQIKVRAPIWKKEFYTDGETEWVRGHTLCCHAKTAAKKTHIILLAGGQSLRMGEDKALLHIGGTTLLENRFELFKTDLLVPESNVWISGKYDHAAAIHDKVDKRGPIGGIYSVTTELQSRGVLNFGDNVIVVPVDMPLLEISLMKQILQALEQNTAAHFLPSELPCGFIYSHKAEKVLAEMVKETKSLAKCSVQSFLKQVGASALTCYEENKLANVNTPIEWQRFNDEHSTFS
ncbi:MAG: hypothetical protein A2Z20_07170 [Bdellovibrionales bacterium RBG_16_40_8]|nr:MAG: hypothetical protein A2Z20_07170 [Bdellovibrionales bacterium RBG_16_40_8]